jgi:hypothetical protein
MKKQKSSFRHIPVDPAIKQLLFDTMTETLSNFEGYSHSWYKLKSIRAISYRKEPFYIIGFTRGLAVSEADKKRSKNAYLKLAKLEKAIKEIEPRIINQATRTSGEYSLATDYGGILDKKAIKREKMLYVKDYSNAINNQENLRYAIVNLDLSFAMVTDDGKPLIDSNMLLMNRRYHNGFITFKTQLKSVLDGIKGQWEKSASGKLQAVITKQRQKHKNMPVRLKSTNYGSYSMSAGVMTAPNQFLTLYHEKMRVILEIGKEPMNDERHIGVEIEASVPNPAVGALKQALVKSGYAQYMALGSDGSVTENSSYDGLELRICAPTSMIDRVVTAACKAFRAVKARVDETCGVHVHLDARPIVTGDNSMGYLSGNSSKQYQGVSGAQAMFKKLVKQQLALFLTQPASRRANTYCKWNQDDSWDEGDRYHVVNPTSFKKYQTVEVRLHSGTIMEHKIINWIRLLEAIAYGPAKRTAYQTVEGLVNGLSLPLDISSYFIERAEKFKDAPMPTKSRNDDDYTNYGDVDSSEAFETEEEWPTEDFEDMSESTFIREHLLSDVSASMTA